MTINQNLTTMNYTAGDGTDRIKYIVMHYTGNDGDTAWGNTNYFKDTYRGASAHYFVDETSIWQCVQDKDISWHCGTDGDYVHPTCRNTNSIGIEICSRRDENGTYYFKEETVVNTIWLARMLMEKYSVPISGILRHYDITGKICPAPYVNNPAAWNTFKEALTETEEEDMTEAEVRAIADASAKTAIEKYVKDLEIKQTSDWAVEFWKEAVNAGVFDGTMPRSDMTREQAAAVFSKMGILGLSSNQEVSGWAQEAWDRMVSEGFIDGKNPREALTREQLAVILEKMFPKEI